MYLQRARWKHEVYSKAELLRCLATYRHRAKVVDDAIWQELTSINGRMTVGHAYLCERRRTMNDRLTLVDEWQRDVAQR